MMGPNVYTILQVQLSINVPADIHGMECLAFLEEANKTAHQAHTGMEINVIALTHNLEFYLEQAYHPLTLSEPPLPPLQDLSQSLLVQPQQPSPLLIPHTLFAVLVLIGNLLHLCVFLLPLLHLPSPPLHLHLLQLDLLSAHQDGLGMESDVPLMEAWEIVLLVVIGMVILVSPLTVD